MDLTTALTSMLPLIVVISAVLAAALSLILLRRYRTAVLRSMGTGQAPADPSAQPSAPQMARKSLKIVTLTSADSAAGNALYQAATHSLRELAYTYCLSGLIYAALMSAPWLLHAGPTLPVTRLLWLVVVYFWPAILALMLVATPDKRSAIGVLSGYIFVLFIAVWIALQRNPELHAGELLYFWLFANGASTVLLATFANRRVRAVGPLVLAFMVAGVSGAMLAVTAIGGSETLLRGAASIGDAVGLGALGTLLLLNISGFAVLGLVGWGLLLRLGRAYQNKQLSDHSLTVDSMWLLFAIMQSFTLAFEGWPWVFTGLCAFAAARWIANRRLKSLLPKAAQKRARSLLVLRVFALGRRSERLFNWVARRWLRMGSIELIAGPDLLASTVEPHEFLAFVGGRLSRQFLTSEDALQQRLIERDTQPDPDGRYRVNEFFCQMNTWQSAMRQIAAQSDAVLMDLRSFSPQNQGCLWELQQLLGQVSLERILFLTDQGSDRSFLEEKIQQIWQLLPENSLNVLAINPRLQLFVASASPSGTAAHLSAHLFAASEQAR